MLQEMTLNELIEEIKALPKEEKLRRIRSLVQAEWRWKE